jgi:hypothetical protein
MKMSGIFVSALFAASMILGGAHVALAKSGKIESVGEGGKSIVIGGTTYKISGKRTKITVGGKKGNRSKLKVGMQCDAKGKGTAKTVTCK